MTLTTLMMMIMKRERKCGVKCSKDVITALSPTGDGPQSQNSDSVSVFWPGKIVCGGCVWGCGWGVGMEAAFCSLEFHMKHKSVKFYTCQWLSTLWPRHTHKNSNSKIQCMPITRYSYHKPKGQKADATVRGLVYKSNEKATALAGGQRGRRVDEQAGSNNSTEPQSAPESHLSPTLAVRVY